MKEYIAPSVTGQHTDGFIAPIAPAIAVVGLSKAAAFAIGVALGLVSAASSGDKKITGEIPALEPCLD